MKYSATYERTRKMHLEPTSRLITFGAGLMHHYRDIGCVDVKLTPLLNGSPIDDPIELYQCLPYIRKFNMASHIKVDIEAKLEVSKLEEIAN